MSRTIPAGTLITCPSCHDKIALTRVPLSPGIMLEKGLFTFTETQKISNGEQAACRRCHAWWYFRGALHTPEGWLPPPRDLVPADRTD